MNILDCPGGLNLIIRIPTKGRGSQESLLCRVREGAMTTEAEVQERKSQTKNVDSL